MDCLTSNFVAFISGYVMALFSFFGALALTKMGDKDEN